MKQAWIAAAGLAALVGGHAMAQEPMKPSKVRELLMSNDDQTFFKKAASAGQFEVQSGQLALSKTSDPKLKDFAQAMVTDHTKANQDLMALAQKKGVSLDPGLASDDQKELDRLKEDKQGKDFDDDYRKVAVASHKKAVALFDNTAKNSKDADVKGFAGQTLPILEHHGGMAKAL